MLYCNYDSVDRECQNVRAGTRKEESLERRCQKTASVTVTVQM